MEIERFFRGYIVFESFIRTKFLYAVNKFTFLKARKTWVCFGDTVFIQFPTKKAVEFVGSDRKVIDQAIEETRTELKANVDALLAREGAKSLAERGFDLSPFL